MSVRRIPTPPFQQTRPTLPFDALFVFRNGGLHSSSIHSARGILICPIVLGHLPADRRGFEAIRRMLSVFHICSFP
jgi:hypothetical protein